MPIAFVRNHRAFTDAIDPQLDSIANLKGRGRLSELRQSIREPKLTVIFRLQPETVRAKHAGQIEALTSGNVLAAPLASLKHAPDPESSGAMTLQEAERDHILPPFFRPLNRLPTLHSHSPLRAPHIRWFALCRLLHSPPVRVLLSVRTS
jgi:hypothetical protein